MSAVAPIASVRPQRLPAATYQAFAIAPSPRSHTYPLDSADTLLECADRAIGRAGYGSTFFVRQTDTLTGASTLHFFAVRRRAKGVKRYHDYQVRTVHDLYADPLFTVAGDAEGIAA